MRVQKIITKKRKLSTKDIWLLLDLSLQHGYQAVNWELWV